MGDVRHYPTAIATVHAVVKTASKFGIKDTREFILSVWDAVETAYKAMGHKDWLAGGPINN